MANQTLACAGLCEIIEVRDKAPGKGREFYVHYKNCKYVRDQALRLS